MRQFDDAHFAESRNVAEKCIAAFHRSATYVPDGGFSESRKLEAGLLIRVSRALWPSKLECDAHICLNLGFTSENFRLAQVCSHVCYFSWSPFRMEEGNTLPSEHGPRLKWKLGCFQGQLVEICFIAVTFM